MIDKIIETVGLCYGVTLEQLQGESRKGILPEARRMIVLLGWENNIANHIILTSINRNRTYIYSPLRRIRHEIKTYKKVANKYQQINTILDQYKSNNYNK